MSYLSKTPLETVGDAVTDRISDCFNEHTFDSRAHRPTVETLFHRHIGAFSALPGQVSEFRVSEVGYEWRCEYDIGRFAEAASPGKGPFLLVFSLMDLPDHHLPTAALYLFVPASAERYSLSLESLAETHETMIEHFAGGNPTIEMLVNADRFISALTIMQERLCGQVVWH